MTTGPSPVVFDPRILAADPQRRGRILSILEAALLAVESGHAVRRTLIREGNTLAIAGSRYPLDQPGCVRIAGFGKAAAPMGRAAADILGDRLAGGLLVTKVGHTGDHAARQRQGWAQPRAGLGCCGPGRLGVVALLC